MGIILIFILECISGLILFSKVRLSNHNNLHKSDTKVSIIIPARNEEKNIPVILSSIQKQTFRPYEVIVVDDGSTDRTGQIAAQYGVKVIQNTEIPDGWTGKTWAVWNGYKNSSGDVLVFLDADVRLAPKALESLVKTRERCGGVISVVPFNYTEKFYERLSLILSILGAFAFTSPFERNSRDKGLYGSCIVATREDYEKINGHESISRQVLDDMTLGKRFSRAGISVNNFIGSDLVSFRMYPNGLKSEIEGYSKSAVLGTAALSLPTVLMIAFWVIGLITAGLGAPILLLTRNGLSMPFLAGYILYAIQIYYFARHTGYYGKVMPAFYFIPSLFFIFIMLYSIYQVKFLGHVVWKGRRINVGSWII